MTPNELMQRLTSEELTDFMALNAIKAEEFERKELDGQVQKNLNANRGRH